MQAFHVRAFGIIAPVFMMMLGYFLLNSPQNAPAQNAPAAANYECRWATGTITLDGIADELAWKNASTIDSFQVPLLVGKDARAAKTKTRAKLLWDHEFLYFHADMEDATLYATVEAHDGETWRDDVFELFFHPDRKKTGYYEFEVTPKNTQLDAYFPKQDIMTMEKQLRVGEFGMKTAVKIRGSLGKSDKPDSGWSVEGRIPWSDFLRTGGRPNDGESWGFSLCRMDYSKDGKESELSSTSKIEMKKFPAFFHQTEDFGTIKFIGEKVEPVAKLALPKRVPLTTSTVIGSPEPPQPFRVKRVLNDFRPRFPIMAKLIPGTQEMLVITQPASYSATTISHFKWSDATNTKALVKLFDTPEKGSAYDFAFHPKFAENGFVYIGWNGAGKGKVKSKFSRITRYTIDQKAFTIDEKTAKTIVEWESDGHNGAAVCFGNDGYLYVTSGDGTSDSDGDNMGQRPDGLLAKVLRLDVDTPANGKAYSVPKDNPYVNDKRFAPETWAYGLRNPWRIACDTKTGHIWVGNNGQDLWEQAYFVRKGDNFGWSVVEGSHPFYEKRTVGPTPIMKPTIEHHHSEFRSLTGGIVYHGKKLPELQGAYIYGDYSTGRIWAMKHDGTKPLWHKELATSTIKITGFGEDPDGELLIFDHAAEGTGGFYTLEPTPQATGDNKFPKKLSDSGLFENISKHAMKAGIVPYSVNAPFWSDGLYKERFIAIPGEETIEYKRTRGWNFPNQTVIVKSFAIEKVAGDAASRKWIETRFMTKQDGEWYGYTYNWNDEGTDATLVPSAGLDREFTVKDGAKERKQVWRYPSRSECMICHSRAANFVLGLCSMQMNKDHAYAGGSANQIMALQQSSYLKMDFLSELRHHFSERGKEQGLKDTKLEEFIREHLPQANQSALNEAAAAETLPKLVNPEDVKQDLTLRAKSWLHTNCASCHVEAGGGNALMELEFNTKLDKMRLLDVKPLHFNFDMPDAKLLAPGKPDQSVLLKRMAIRGQHQMPPIGTNRIEEPGVKLIQEWIRSLK